MASTGSIVFDGLVVTTIDANLIEKTLTARAAFVDTKKGTTHGWTEGTGTIWSEETKTALTALAESMERDLGKIHFSHMTNAPSRKEGVQVASGGLAEHLDADDAPSV